MATQDTWSSIANTYVSSYFSRRRTWVRTTGFKSLPSDSKPVNDYDDKRTYYTQQSREQSYYITKSTGVKTVVANAGYLFTGAQIETMFLNYVNSKAWNPDPYAVENGMLVSLYGNVADSKTNLAVMYAEAAKTSNLILDTANRIDRAYRALRKGQFKRVARILNLSPNTVHKTWLEYKYGWTPLLLDVVNSAEFLAQQSIGRPTRFNVKSRFQREMSFSDTTNYAAYGGGAPGTYTQTLKTVYGAKKKLWMEVENSPWAELQQLGLTNPALVAWELVPFSFVFDWFIQIGSYLEAVSAFRGVKVRRAMRSNYVDFEYEYRQPATTRETATYIYFNAAFNFTAPYRQYTRNPFTPDPLAIYPPRGRPLSFQKMITSLALLKAGHRSGTTRI